MRHLAPLAVVYLLIAALIVPASPFAAEDEAQQPAGEAAGPAETTPEATAPAAPPPPQAPPGPPAAPQQPPPVEQPPEPQPDAPAEAKPGKPVARAAAPGSVAIKDFSFGPAAVTVNVGESVTWTNSGPSAHTATAGDGSFDTGLLSRGQSRSVTFRKAGSFSYICTPHPNMKGTVRVVAASSGGGGGGGSEGSSAGSTGAGDVADQGSTAGSTGAGEAGGSGAALPKSGAEAEALAALGLLLLLLGASTYRRVDT